MFKQKRCTACGADKRMAVHDRDSLINGSVDSLAPAYCMPGRLSNERRDVCWVLWVLWVRRISCQMSLLHVHVRLVLIRHSGVCRNPEKGMARGLVGSWSMAAMAINKKYRARARARVRVRSRRTVTVEEKKPSVLLDSGVRRNDNSATKNQLAAAHRSHPSQRSHHHFTPGGRWPFSRFRAINRCHVSGERIGFIPARDTCPDALRRRPQTTFIKTRRIVCHP